MRIELEEIMWRTSRRLCLLCYTNLDRDIGEGKWHIPLCKKHRKIEFDKSAKEINKLKNETKKLQVSK